MCGGDSEVWEMWLVEKYRAGVCDGDSEVWETWSVWCMLQWRHSEVWDVD